MTRKRYIIGLLFFFGCLLSMQATPEVRLSFTTATATINQYRFTRPQVTVYDGTTNVTNLFNINYYVRGQEGNITKKDNKDVTTSTVTGTQVTVLYGYVTIGSHAGTDIIDVKVTGRDGTSYAGQTAQSAYTIVIPKITPNVKLSQDAIIAYAGETIAYPTALLTNDDGDILNSKYNYVTMASSGITPCETYKIKSMAGLNLITMPTTLGTNETVTITYTPNSDNENDYTVYSKIFHVTVVEKPSDNIPTTMDWPNGNTLTLVNWGNFTVPSPRVRDNLGNDISQLFKYDYQIVGNYTTSQFNVWSTNKYWGTWEGNVFTYGRMRLNVKTLSMDHNELPAENDGFTTCADSCFIHALQRENGVGNVTVTVEPKTFYTYADRLTPDNWSLPKITITEDGYEQQGYKLIGIPHEGVETNLPQKQGSIEYKGIVYDLYPAHDWEFPHTDWANWYIDYTNYKSDAPRMIIDANAGNYERYGHNILDYQIVKLEKLTTSLLLSEYTLTANVVNNKLMAFTEPAASVRDVNGTVVTDHFNLSYAFDSSSLEAATAAGLTIDASTGTISYSTISTIPSQPLKINVSATAKDDAAMYETPVPVTYTLQLVQSAFTYEIISEGSQETSSAYGKLHFLSGTEMASGTVIDGIPGLSVQFGSTTDDKWTLDNSDNNATCQEGTNKDKTVSAVFVSGNAVTNIDSNVPQDGTYLILRPYTNGFLSIDAKWQKDNLYVLLEADGDKDVQNYRPTADEHREHRFGYPLIAGHTYYFYNYGNGTVNNPLYLHGINFEPAFIITDKDLKPSHKSTVFVNGYTGSASKLLTTANHHVAFSIKAVEGTTVGTDLKSYVTVDANSGALMPLKSTSGITGTVTGDSAGCVRLMAAVKTKEATRYPWLYLFVSAIPSYVVQNGELPIVGQVVTTTNIPTAITMTYGGWTDGSGPYKHSKTLKDLVDYWRTAKTDTVGRNDMTIDGFSFATQGDQNATDENGKSFNTSINNGSHQPWELPCRGTYLQFNPRENGTLMVYLLQNGCIDYTGTGTWGDVKNGYQLKYRPLFIVDETGNAVTLDHSWAIDTSLLPETSRQASYAGRYTEGQYRTVYNDKTVKTLLQNHGTKITTYDYSDCSFDLSAYASHQEDLKLLMAQWKTYDGTSATARQEIIPLTQGYALISKAFVRYTFQVKAGKTYYVFMRGSKLSNCGFSFVPAYYQQARPDSMVLDLQNNDDFSKVFSTAVMKKNSLQASVEATAKAKSATQQKAASNELTTNELDNINVRLNRSFAKDKWTGVCFPFSISERQFKKLFGNDALIITYDSVSGDSAFFSQHVYHMIVANYPYYIKPSQDVAADQLIDSVTVEKGYAIKEMSDGANYTSLGVYAPTQAIAGSYVFAGNNIYHLRSALQLPTYRAYLKPLSANAAKISHFAMKTAGSKGVITDMDEDSPLTGIQELLSDEDGTDSRRAHGHAKGVYNLQGIYLGDSQVLPALPHGVYIVDGKLVSL